jgi:hypothetical protein
MTYFEKKIGGDALDSFWAPHPTLTKFDGECIFLNLNKKSLQKLTTFQVVQLD